MKILSLRSEKKFIYRDYLFTFLIIFSLFNLFFLIHGLWPYGEGIIVQGDSIYQIGRLGVNIFDVFEGKSTLFYTNHIANGVEILSSIEYMLLSPFYLVALPLGREMFIYMLNISVLLMCLFNGLIFLHFIRKHFKNVGEVSRVMLSLMFCFGSYLCYAFPFITWLSFPGITILTIDGFLDLVKSKKILKFIVGTSWLVVTSFYLGVSANIVLVLLFSVYAIFVVDKGERGEVLVKLLFSYIISAVACLIILLPAIFGLTQTSRMNENLSTLFSSKDSSYGVYIRFCSMLLDALIFIFAVLYFVFADKKTKTKKFFIFAFLILLVPYIADSCLKILCFGSYVGLPFRLTFLNQALAFLLAAKFLNSEPLKRLQDCKNNRMFLLLASFLVGLLVICYTIMIALFGDALSYNLKCGIYTIELPIWAFALFLSIGIIVGFLIFLGLRRLLSRRTIATFISIIMFVSLGINISIFACNMGNSYRGHENALSVLNSSEPNSLFTTLHSEKEEIFMNLSNFITPNNRASSMFSSLINKKLCDSFISMGFTINTVAADANSNALSEALFGVQYYISSMDLDRPYLTKIKEQDQIYLYKNELATTGAVVLDPIEFGDDGFLNLEAIKNSLHIDGELFRDVEIDGEYEELDKESAKYLTCLKKCRYTATEDCILYSSGAIANVSSFITDSLFTRDQVVLACQYASDYPGNDVSFVHAGETVEFYVTSSRVKKDVIDGLKFRILNYNTLKQVTDELKKRQADIEFGRDGYRVSVPEGLSGTLTVFACDLDGMEYSLNGKSVDAQNLLAYWASFSVKGGENIVAKYHSPIETFWIVFALVGVAIIVILCLLCKKCKFKALQRPVKVAFLVLDGIILSVIYVFGLVLSIFV